MGKRARFDKMHRAENVNRWEWKAEGRNRIVAVPRYGEHEFTAAMRNGDTAADVFLYALLLPMLLLLISGEMFIGAHSASFLRGFPVMIVYSFTLIYCMLRVIDKINEFKDKERPLFALKVPYNDFRPNATMTELQIQYTKLLAAFLNETKDQANGVVPLGGKYMGSRNIAGAYYDEITSLLRLRSGDIIHGVRVGNLTETIDDTMINRWNRLAGHSDPSTTSPEIEASTAKGTEENNRDAGALGITDKASTQSNLLNSALLNSNMTVPGNSDTAKQGAEALSFFQQLAEENDSVKDLPTAAKRWASLSPRDRSDLLLIAAEIKPILAMVKEARELERSEFLADAETTLEEIIALGEATAERMNRDLDQLNLDNITVRHIFLKDKFHISTMASPMATDPLPLTKE